MKYILEGQETDRLRFRLLTRNDFDIWLNLFKEPGVGGFLGMADIPTAQEQCEKWFSLAENRYKNDLGGMNVLVDKITNKMVGQCGLLIQEVDDIKALEIGYSILPEFRGMGYATEAAKKCRDYAFEHQFTKSLISIIHIDNVMSEKVAMRNGMKLSKKTIFKGMPVHIYRIDIEEWKKRK